MEFGLMRHTRAVRVPVWCSDRAAAARSLAQSSCLFVSGMISPAIVVNGRRRNGPSLRRSTAAVSATRAPRRRRYT